MAYGASQKAIHCWILQQVETIFTYLRSLLNLLKFDGLESGKTTFRLGMREAQDTGSSKDDLEAVRVLCCERVL